MSKLAAAALHQLRLLLTALQFFTRLPVPRWVGFDPAWRAASTPYFPAIGLLVGLLTAAAYWLALQVWPAAVAALLSTACGIWLTGALHEDGWADVCDGLGGSASAEGALEIMRDSRLGTYGVLGLLLALGLKCTTLALLPAPLALTALLVAHPLSRFASVTLMAGLDYVRQEGKAQPMTRVMGAGALLLAAVFGMAPLLLAGAVEALSWPRVGAMMVTVAMTAWLMARLFRRRLGGYTGDCLGAVQQVTELVCYLCLLARL